MNVLIVQCFHTYMHTHTHCDLHTHTHTQELPNDPLNYGLYLPVSSIGKLGKFLNDGLLLNYYALEGSIPRLEVSQT